ncbi:MAG: YfdX family protein [Epsilonproteobacteria bacterium]|nr:YfdX family protein [Campylobacterota bacterium]
MAAERLKEKQEVTQKVQQAKKDYVEKEDKKVSTEAAEAVNMVVEVIKHLQEKNKEKALETIEKVLGKLEVLIARDPSLQLVPVNVQEQVVDFPGTVDDILEIKKVVKELIDEGELQKARDIMLNLASELDIFVTALPIGTYPAAIKVIIPLIEQEKYEEAIALLVEVLETLVVEKIVIPLPILRAEQAIERASELTKDKEDANKEELKELLEYAKEQLLLAQALGYGKISEDYKPLLEEIEKIEQILDTDQSTKNIFETLKEKLQTFMGGFNKVKEPTQMPKASNSSQEEQQQTSQQQQSNS